MRDHREAEPMLPQHAESDQHDNGHNLGHAPGRHANTLKGPVGIEAEIDQGHEVDQARRRSVSSTSLRNALPAGPVAALSTAPAEPLDGPMSRQSHLKRSRGWQPRGSTWAKDLPTGAGAGRGVARAMMATERRTRSARQPSTARRVNFRLGSPDGG